MPPRARAAAPPPEADKTIGMDPHDAPEEVLEESAEASEPPDPFAEPAALTGAWAPAEAAQFLLAIWNSGFLLFGQEWLAKQDQFDWWSPAAAQLLDRAGIPPPSAGGASPLMIALAQCGAGISGVAMSKAHVFRGGLREAVARGPIFKAMRRDEAPANTPDAQERPAPAAAPAQRPPAQQQQAPQGFRFDPAVQAGLEQVGPRSEDFGIGVAA